MKLNETYEVIIDRLNHQGKGICIINDKVVFVENALPGEQVKIKINHISKKYIEAHVIEYKSTNKDRITPICPYYNECGGCNIMHMSYSYQHQFKLEKVKDIIRKFVHIEIPINEVVGYEQYYYRNKATFHVSETIGFYKEKSYELIPLEKCLISSKEINETLSILKKMNLKNIKNIVVRSSNFKKTIMVIFDVIGKINEEKIIKILKNTVTSIYIKDKLIYGDKYIIDKIGNMEFVISPESFFQVNTPMAYKLYSKVKEYAGKNNRLLDLYCGTGTIGLFVGSNELIGIEINKSAVNDANVNKKINDINAKFICGDSGEELKKLNKKFDVVIVDPPRSGLSNLAINEVISIKAKKVIYVSCDPVTLARDLNILKEYYDIKEISLFDLFPNTDHIESVALLVKKLEK